MHKYCNSHNAYRKEVQEGYTVLVIIATSISQGPTIIKANIRYASPAIVAA